MNPTNHKKAGGNEQKAQQHWTQVTWFMKVSRSQREYSSCNCNCKRHPHFEFETDSRRVGISRSRTICRRSLSRRSLSLCRCRSRWWRLGNEEVPGKKNLVDLINRKLVIRVDTATNSGVNNTRCQVHLVPGAGDVQGQPIRVITGLCSDGVAQSVEV